MDAATPPRPDAGADVHTTTARTLEALEGLRETWDGLGNDIINADLDYLAAVVRTMPGVLRPHVVVAERSGAPEAVLVGRFERAPLPCSVGYRTVSTPSLRVIRVAYGGLLGNPPDSTVAAVVAALRRTLADGEADVVVFRELPVGSALHRMAGQSGPLVRDHVSRPATHRELRLPASLDAFFASLSKSTRDGTRRYRNKVERELGDRLAVRVYREVEELDEVMATLDAVAARSWQQNLGATFRDDEANRERTRLALERGWFRACAVLVDGRPVAFWHGLARRGRLISGIPGFDPAFAEYRIGTYALLKLIEDLCGDPEISTLDFGFGDAEYKRRFATAEWEEQTAMIFAPRLKPVAVNLMRTGLVGTSHGLRTSLERVGLVGRTRTRWRARLAARGGASGRAHA